MKNQNTNSKIFEHGKLLFNQIIIINFNFNFEGKKIIKFIKPISDKNKQLENAESASKNKVSFTNISSVPVKSL